MWVHGVEMGSFWEDTVLVSQEESAGLLISNRLRFQGLAGLETIPEVSATLILDNNTLSLCDPDTLSLENRLSIYRAYLEYAGEKHFVVLGKQRVPFGVGRIWNPVDVFNPIDSFSVEPDERKGTSALRYEYAINQLSNFDLTVSRHKSAVRVKSYLAGADIALLAVVDTAGQLDIVGWELEGELFETGIELRSEGGLFHDRSSGERHFELVLGGEYGFAGSLNLLGEYLYNDETHAGLLGLSASYTVSLLLSMQFTAVVALSDHSAGFIPAVVYSLGDDMSISGSVIYYHGNSGEEFGDQESQYVLRWFIHL